MGGSLVDTSAFGQGVQAVSAAQQNEQNAYNQMLQRQGINALQNVNPADQASVSNALSGLLKAGMVDQAKSLVDLVQTRALNQANLPNIQAMAAKVQQGLAQQDQSSDQTQAAPQQGGMTDDQRVAFRQAAQASANMAHDVASIKEPGLRGAQAAVYARQLQQQFGMSPEGTAEVFGDTSDPDKLKQWGDFLQGVANGETPDHPTGMSLMKQQLAADPVLAKAQANLTGMWSDPLLQGYAAKYLGVDVSPGMQQNIAETGPMRSAAASAPYTTVQVEGPLGQNTYMSAANFAAGQAQPGAQPIYGATPGVKTAQTAAANAPYQAIETVGPGGQKQVQSAAQFAAGRGAPQTIGTPTGPMNAPPITGPSIAQATGIGAEATAGSEAAIQSERNAAGFTTRMRDYENLRMAAAQIPTGPHANFWGFVNGLRAEYAPDLPVLRPNATNQANYEEVKKLAQRILSYQTDTLGLPKTNQSVDITSGATPHEETSPAGIQRLTAMLEGNDVFLNARNMAFKELLARRPDLGPQDWNKFIDAWNPVMDPGIFQAHFMTAPEREMIRQRMGPARFDAMTAAAQRKGYFARY